MSKYIKNNFIKEWTNAVISQTHTGEYGTAHICTNDLICEAAAERQKEAVSEYVYNALYRQAVKKSKEQNK